MGTSPQESLQLLREFVDEFDKHDFQHLRDVMEEDAATAARRLERFGELHTELIDPEIEIDISAMDNWAVFLPPAGRGRGLRTWGEFWSNWFEAWEANEVERLRWESGDGWVIVETRNVLHGRSSGARVEFVTVQLWRLRDGRVVAYSVYPTREQAVAAAGQPLR